MPGPFLVVIKKIKIAIHCTAWLLHVKLPSDEWRKHLHLQRFTLHSVFEPCIVSLLICNTSFLASCWWALHYMKMCKLPHFVADEEVSRRLYVWDPACWLLSCAMCLCIRGVWLSYFDLAFGKQRKHCRACIILTALEGFSMLWCRVICY